MNHAARKLLSPYRLGNLVLKNRIVATTSEPHYLSGPEPVPNDRVIRHYRDKAKGAAIVNVTGFGEQGDTRKYPPFLPMTQFPDYDCFDARNLNQIIRLTDTIHFYGSAACMVLDFFYEERRFRTPDGQQRCIPKRENIEDYTIEELHAITEFLVMQSVAAAKAGFDMVSIHCAYGRTLPARILSGLYNHRTDAYGGSNAGRARLILETAQAIKKACPGMPVHMLISAEEEAGGNTLADSIEILHILDGAVDMVEIRGSNADLSHPTGFDEETPSLAAAAQVKASGVKMAVQAVGGFFRPEVCEEAIASGKVDFVGMARAWICDPEYGEKLYEGRLEDIRPCIRCNKCHTYQLHPPFRSACSVNPWVSLEADRETLPFRHYTKKRIAVIGGGPAGLTAAAAAADRGHSVTLFEASDRLGGQLCHADHVSFKWPLRDFKNWLIREVTEKRPGIEVRLNTPVTPEDIRREGYDVVLAGIGSEPVLPPIPGLREHAIPVLSIFGNTESLGRSVIIVGGGEIGMEAAMYLSENGIEATVVEMRDTLAADANPVHYRANLDLAWSRAAHVTGLTDTTVTEVTAGGITWHSEKTGETGTLTADSVIAATGMRAMKEEALAFADAAPGFAAIGDAGDSGNNLLNVMQSAAFAPERF